MSQETKRTRQVADQVRHQVSQLIDRKVKDPDKGFVTVTRVKMSPDLRLATIYFTVIGDDEQRKRSLTALKRATSFLRRELSGQLQLRSVPELRFHFDDSLEYAHRINELLQRVQKENADRSDESRDDSGDEPG